MKRSSLVIVTFFLACFSLSATAEPAKQQSVKQLMQLTGAGNLSVQILNQLVTSFKRMAPNQPQKFWDDFAAQADPDELENMIIPIYQKYLSEKEIQQLIEFYSSPLGKKLVSVQPQIMQESIQVGQEWGKSLARDVSAKINSGNSKP